MNLFRWLSRTLPSGAKRGNTARWRLSKSYQRLFTGHGSDEDAEIVLSDLANFSGFYRVNGEGVSGEDRAFSDGQRATFARVFRFVRMTDAERQALEEAARAEALADVEEGYI